MITRLTGRLPVAALDLLIVSVAVAALGLLWWRRANVRLLSAALTIAVLAALLWLSFLALWGWHYQVPTLETRLSLRPADVGAARGEAFARATVTQLNGWYPAAHATAWPSRADLPAILAPRLAAVLPHLGVATMPALPAPRPTMLDWYFRAGGIDGMTNPFGLEVLLNSRVLPLELPALAAHEYAHLAGFADEADASVVAWLACQSGSPALRYSSALAVLPHLLTGLPRETQRAVIGELGAGPLADLRAIAARLADQKPWVHAFAWQFYDRFLRANRVSEGVARYDAVARVLIGAADPTTGTLRRWPQPWPPSR
ncbi:hypothetical protein LuPra_02986 [Luteitalea pratensis]|uniref:DUF3810 domain-containing protein n=1 Tax=Luteitalea pratensis TaxID=1855912 RepID=A0A143PME4_LUTPR|nr:hypothetical protein LuPra_02986 [Luteitalea pratensis]